MQRRELLLGIAALALPPAEAEADTIRTASQPSLSDDPETRETRRWIGFGFGVFPVAYLAWILLGKIAGRWRRVP